ncbi:hypothetical protein [Mycoplasmopsis columboralis]|uniref:Lipoprotein n=1 Tax=Mycoplasmopsis columboralis TaxID=171282 RepID=A0A449B720_9BACT|nr:hypothetical protein [Mycoplasmopsis columboralis]VEU76376.1 Uncharacterised protein [Mycoplasmopsis columboralis]
MKKLFKTLTIFSATTLPVALAISCNKKEEQKTQNKKLSDYAKENPSWDDLKNYYLAFIDIIANSNPTDEQKASLSAEFQNYWQKQLTAKATQDPENYISKFIEILEEYKNLQTLTNKQKEGLGKFVDPTIAALRLLAQPTEPIDNTSNNSDTNSGDQSNTNGSTAEEPEQPSQPKQPAIEFTIANKDELLKHLEKATDSKPYISLYFNSSSNSYNFYQSDIALLTVPAGTPALSGMKSDGVSPTKGIKVYKGNFAFPEGTIDPVVVKEGYIVVQYVLDGQVYNVDLMISQKSTELNSNSDSNSETTNDSNNSASTDNSDATSDTNTTSDETGSSDNSTQTDETVETNSANEQEATIVFTPNSLDALKAYVAHKEKDPKNNVYFSISLSRGKLNEYYVYDKTYIGEKITFTIPERTTQLHGVSAKDGSISTKGLKVFIKSGSIGSEEVEVAPSTVKIQYSEDGETLHYATISLV